MFALADIERHHGGRPVLALDRLEIGADGMTALLGHNGSGKSTLMQLLARQDRPDGGTITLDGLPLGSYSQKALARRVAYLPQRLPQVPGLTVRELVKLGRFPWCGALGRWQRRDHEAVDEAMSRTGVSGLADTLADEVSGGERQRAWIAMLLAQDAPVLLLDEPTAALDLAHAYDVMSLLRRLAREAGRHVVTVLHDVNLAARHAERIVALKSGRVAFEGAADRFLDAHVLRDLYGLDMALLPDGSGGRHAVVA